MPLTSLAIAPDPESFPDIRGLEQFWSVHTFRSQEDGDRAARLRPLLDVLGLGLEQTLRYLAEERPDFADFQRWILATAGEPTPDRVARFHAWLDSAPVPEATAQALRAIDAAPDVLDAADLAHWEEHGYVVLRQAITLEEAAAAAELVWRQVEAVPEDPDTWYGPRSGIMIQHFQDPALEAARQATRVHKAFAQLWGTSDLWMITDRISFNAPERANYRFPGPHLHFDVSLALPIPFATQGILYLTDTSADQGAFQLVPGFQHEIVAWLESLGDADPRAVDLSARGKPIAAGAGDLILWRQDLPHGASPNRSNKPRIAQYINMYPADLTANPVWR